MKDDLAMFDATDENDFKLPWWFYVGEHILTRMKKSGVLATVHIVG